MTYSIKEIYYTLQGEGANTGRPAVFCRFTGCNLWSGREEHRSTAVCQFCDTDFVGVDGPGGGKFNSPECLAKAVAEKWPTAVPTSGKKLVVCTGGEPLLQLNSPLVQALHAHDFEVAIETNGSLLPPSEVDWICVSPKAGARLLLVSGDELKLVYPQIGAEPEHFGNLNFHHFFLQPLDGPDKTKNTELAVAYCLSHPNWRLSVQTHKLLGIP